MNKKHVRSVVWHTRLLYTALAAGLAGFAVEAAAAGVAWQANGVQVCSDPSSQETPYIVGLDVSGSIVVWADRRGSDYNIYAQRLDAEGRRLWQPGEITVCSAPYDQQFPVACEDGASGVIVVWQDGRKGDDGMELYAQRINPDGSLAWQADGVPVCTHAANLEDPPTAFSHVIISDGAGGAIVAWRDTRADPVAGNTEIYAQRINGSGVPLWTANGVKVLGFATQKWATRNPVLASDGANGAVVVWQDARNSAVTGNDLYAQRVSSAGVPLWTTNGVAVCNAPGEQGYPDIVELAGAQTAIVWEDKRSGSYDIYAQKLDAAGVPQWGANGRLVCDSANDQRTPRVITDGAGGVLVAWTDKRNSSLYTDIYAQRLSPSGSPVWMSQGAAVCTATGSQTRIRMCPSVSGRAILTWMDTRNETAPAVYDIFGQMIDQYGLVQWAEAGIPVGAIPGTNQRMQQAASDGMGGLLTVWEDDRNSGDWDVYAQRLTPWTLVTGISDAKSQLGGTPVVIPAGIVSAVFADCIYVQDPTRCSGIKVLCPLSVAVGDLVTVWGTVEPGCERYIIASRLLKASP
ncbi:MAG: hypothetical protein ACP5R5_09425 [Armatimonadota bacterium]